MVKAGILGGGQLGRMLLQEAANLPVETYVMELDADCPAAHLCHHFVEGNTRNYDEVLAFGRQVEVITIEIESVNVDALETLEQEGKKVVPAPSVMRIIQNKIRQKQFYRENGIPSPDFVVTHSLQDLHNHKHLLPAVHKIGEGGYDGRGVQILESEEHLHLGFDAPALLETKVDIFREISLIVAVGSGGEMVLYPPVEMVFDPYLNLLDYQLCPADISPQVMWKVEAIGVKLAKALGSAGIFAIEMLIDNDGDVWVNETAPRVHNSGHHTIEAHITSQYEMLWRIMLGYPLGSTALLQSSALINLIGAPGHSGDAAYIGIEKLLAMENVYVHVYGKSQTKPGRKMGHITILGSDRLTLLLKGKQVKEQISVQAKP